MAAVALGWGARRIRLDNDPYVNRGFLATAVTKISDVVHNPG
jgi:hypothetical protein